MSESAASGEERHAACRLLLGVYGLLSGLVAHSLDALIQPDAVALGDIDGIATVLNEVRPVLSVHNADLVERGVRSDTAQLWRTLPFRGSTARVSHCR